MDFNEYLSQECVPALGCTEPAAIAYASMRAAEKFSGAPTDISLTIDPKIYKNCHAVGIPHSGHKTGIKWAASIGCFLKNRGSGLQCFRGITGGVLKNAGALIKKNRVKITIDRTRSNLFIDITIKNSKETGRCIIENAHTNAVLLKYNNKNLLKLKKKAKKSAASAAGAWAASLSIKKILNIASTIDKKARAVIRNGASLNIAIAKHGLTLFPKSFVKMTSADPLTRIAAMVCAGVYARMWGEDFSVMSIAGSGNKGIVCAVPLLLLEKEWQIPPEKTEEALAIASLFTSKTTKELGTLSAVCGCSNAAGIGLACALVYLKDGGEREISYAINNMVGNVTGMICDGAKIGCALKTMTSVDAAFRAATLALSGIGIPVEDGIVGRSGDESLANMGRIANLGMIKTDEEILKIMRSKL